jgi:hypothetical protein
VGGGGHAAHVLARLFAGPGAQLLDVLGRLRAQLLGLLRRPGPQPVGLLDGLRALLLGLLGGLGAQLVGLLGRPGALVVGLLGRPGPQLVRLLASLAAHLLRGRLRGLDDPLDLGRRRGRHWLGGGAVHALELVGDFTQMRVHRGGLVAPPCGREIGALDG